MIGAILQNKNLVAATGWMLLGLLSFLGLMVSVRELSSRLSLFEMLTLRSVVAFCALILFITIYGKPVFTFKRFKLHLARNIFHFFGQYCWASGVILLPLAEVIAIEFTTPIWAVLLAALYLNERLTGARLLALAVGFVGVCIIIRPGFESIEWGSVMVLLATFGFAFTMLFSKKLTSTDSVWTILMYMAVIQFFIGLGPTIYYWQWPVGIDYFWITVIGLSGLLAHLGLTKALSLADTATILPLDYLRLPLTLAIGYFFYQETGDWWVLLGASIIFAANYYHLSQESRRRI
ncbi:MAG: drug/metabolite transporter (DMT)-like permease [Planctomycetota bacterium]